MPRALARASLMTTAAAAPSLIGELFPAVTLPLAWNAGFNLARTSREVSESGSSSVSKRNVRVVGFDEEDLDLEEAPLPLLESDVIFTSTGMVSSLKFPVAIAARAFLCELAENSSAWSRVIPNLRAMFSVPTPMLIYASR